MKIDWKNVGIFDGFNDGHFFWFSSVTYNALFRINKETGETKYIGSFPNERFDSYRLYSSVNEYKGKLFFTPCSAREIGVYDIKNERFEKIDIGIAELENDLSKVKFVNKFISAFIHGGKLIMLPCCYDKTVMYDIETNRVSENNNLFNFFYKGFKKSSMSYDSEFYCCWFAKKINDSEVIFNLHCNKNIIVFYNLKTAEYREKIIGNVKRSYSLIEYRDRHVYLYDGLKDVLVIWDMQSDKCSEYYIEKEILNFRPCGLNHSFVNMVLTDNALYFIPGYAKMAVKYEPITKKFLIDKLISVECLMDDEEIAYLNLCRFSENELILYANRTKELVMYDEVQKLRRIKIKIDPFVPQKYMRDMIYRGYNVFNEYYFFNTTFLNMLTNSETSCTLADKDENRKNMGYKIYSNVSEK